MMNALNEVNKIKVYKKNPIKVKKKLCDAERKKNKYTILGDKCQFLGKKVDNVIKFYKKYIKIIDIKNCFISCFYLNEISNITCLTTNEKGNKIYVGFENGSIFEYKIKDNIISNHNVIYPFYEINIKSEELINENIFDLNYMSNTNNNEKQNNEKFFNSIALLKNIDNDFNLNNPYIPEEITCIKINEVYNVLIASSIKN